MKSSTRFIFIFLFIFAFSQRNSTYAASTTGVVQAVVIAAIGITYVSPLNFGNAVPGDTTKIIAAGTVESATNGSFNVTGQANTPYQIQLPTDGTVTMIVGAGGATRTIAVNSFVSFPVTSGLLSAGGTQLLLVGATRAALPTNQTLGSYTGNYTVTVIY